MNEREASHVSSTMLRHLIQNRRRTTTTRLSNVNRDVVPQREAETVEESRLEEAFDGIPNERVDCCVCEGERVKAIGPRNHQTGSKMCVCGSHGENRSARKQNCLHIKKQDT